MALRVELVFSSGDPHPLRVGFAARVQNDPIIEWVDKDEDGTPVIVTYSGQRLRLNGVHVMEVS